MYIYWKKIHLLHYEQKSLQLNLYSNRGVQWRRHRPPKVHTPVGSHNPRPGRSAKQCPILHSKTRSNLFCPFSSHWQFFLAQVSPEASVLWRTLRRTQSHFQVLFKDLIPPFYPHLTLLFLRSPTQLGPLSLYFLDLMWVREENVNYLM